jgi:hypothetical protein
MDEDEKDTQSKKKGVSSSVPAKKVGFPPSSLPPSSIPSLTLLFFIQNQHQNKRARVEVKHSGGEFAAKKAKGDIKKEGKPDPYAYIPLNPKLLNKRFKTQATNHWKKHGKKD